MALVSPKNAADFIQAILTENKYIQVDNNLSNDKKHQV